MKRARRSTAPAADLGPDVRFRNGTARMVYRADPAAPHAPAIRAARAVIAYEALDPPLPDPAREAADRILTAAEFVSGAREADGPTSRAFWEYQGANGRALQAAKDLREVRQVCGVFTGLAVILLVCNGDARHEAEARDGLDTMAEFWGMG
jgi:hypothetical protein